MVAVALILELPVAAQSLQPKEMASLCILPHVRKTDALRRSLLVPTAAETYSMRLDDGDWFALSPETSVLLKGIPVRGRHNVQIRGDDKPFSAFTFAFDELHTTNACLVQSGMYLVWQFHPSAPSYTPCKCADVEPVDWKARPRR